MSFQQGLSGLNASSKALDVVGNNVANSSTVGFKSSNGHVADVYAASLSGGGSSQVGIGTSLSAVFQQFTQGNVTATSNPLDIAINGGGFFRVTRDNLVSYTRNGEFRRDSNNFLSTIDGARLTGYAADANGRILKGGVPSDLQLATGSIAPKATVRWRVGTFQ